MMETYLGHISALGTAVFWTITAMAFESAGKRIGSITVNVIRLVMAFGILTVFCWATRGKPLPVDADAHAWLWLSLSGVVGFSLGDLCLMRALVLIGSRLSMLTMSLTPPITAAIAWILMDEKLDWYDLIGITITVSGVCWVAWERKLPGNGCGPNQRSVKGFFLAFLGALGQAVGLVLSKFGMRDYDPFAATQVRIIAGIIGFAVILTCIGWWPRVLSAIHNRQAMTRTALGAFFGPFLGVSLSLLAVQKIQAGVAATIMSLVPVLIIPPAIILFKEKVSLRAILGAVLAVFGIALLFL